MSIDENPPAIHGLHLLGRELWQQVLDPGGRRSDSLQHRSDARLRGRHRTVLPPTYSPLADSLAQVTMQQSSDGVLWKRSTLPPSETATTDRHARRRSDGAAHVVPHLRDGPGGQLAPLHVPDAAWCEATPRRARRDSALDVDHVAEQRRDLHGPGGRVGSGVRRRGRHARRPAPRRQQGRLDGSAPLHVSLEHVAGRDGHARAPDAGAGRRRERRVLRAGLRDTQNSDTTPPVVSFAAPDAGALLSGTVSVTANASETPPWPGSRSMTARRCSARRRRPPTPVPGPRPRAATARARSRRWPTTPRATRHRPRWPSPSTTRRRR